MGDFNAKLGNKEYLQPVAGPYTICDSSNENGNMLIQSAIRNRLIVKSTMIPHNHIHLGTWRIPGSNEVNQIDHVLATSHHSSSFIDVRSCRGPNCDSDHYLVKIKMRERIAKVQKTSRRKTRIWDVEKLQKDIAQTDKYQKAKDLKLKQKMEGEKETDSAQKRWEHLEQAIKAGAEEIIWESKYKRTKNGSMKSVQHILERRINLDRRFYKRRQDLIIRSIKKGEGRLAENVKERRERI